MVDKDVCANFESVNLEIHVHQLINDILSLTIYVVYVTKALLETDGFFETVTQVVKSDTEGNGSQLTVPEPNQKIFPGRQEDSICPYGTVQWVPPTDISEERTNVKAYLIPASNEEELQR